MKLTVVAVLDRAAQTYARPFYVTSIGAAIRAFQDEVNRDAPDNTIYHHPDDFDLYQLGTWDDQTGRFDDLLEPPVQIAIGKQLSTRLLKAN